MIWLVLTIENGLNGRWEWWAVDMHKYIIYYDFNRSQTEKNKRRIFILFRQWMALRFVVVVGFFAWAPSVLPASSHFVCFVLFGHIDFCHNHRITIIEFDMAEASSSFTQCFPAIFSELKEKKLWTSTTASNHIGYTHFAYRRTLSNL